MRIPLPPGLVLLFGCLDAESPQMASVPIATGTPPAPAPPEGSGVRVVVSAEGATQVRVDDEEVYPINSTFVLPEGMHTFVLVGPDGRQSQPHTRQVLPPKNKPSQSIALPPFVPAPPSPVATRPAWAPAPEVSEAGSQPSAVPPMQVRVMVSANNATKVRVDGGLEHPVNTFFMLSEGMHTFVLVGKDGIESPPYAREVVLPKNRPGHTIMLPALPALPD